MQTYEKELEEEREYLGQVTGLVRSRLEQQQRLALEEKRRLTELSRQMYENTVHFSHDFDKLTEANQELGDIETRNIHYQMVTKKLQLYERMLKAPYFARIDFEEDGFECEKIYIGLGNMADENGLDVYVYDWRAPVASLFYRCELGRAVYQSPSGEICGTIELKRQYEIKLGKLLYFFDSSVNIMDDVLRSVLSKNASPQMKAIVETIQREQDVIIRDHESELLMVQGAAGSGKTSVALHRVAYLMYQGASHGLRADNILILSPNSLFGQYISGILPELGEENIQTMTFEELYQAYFPSGKLSSRNSALEQLMDAGPQRDTYKRALEFRLSDAFVSLLDCFAEYWEADLLEFPEVDYAGSPLFAPAALKREFKRERRDMPLAKRLRVLEEQILEEVHRRKKRRLKELEKEVLHHPEHQFEVKAQARLLSIRETSAVAHRIRAFTRVDVHKLYRQLTGDRELLCRIMRQQGVAPVSSEVLDRIVADARSKRLDYADGMAILYLQLGMVGVQPNSGVKQVVIDEAQDYSPIHYHIMRRLWPNARYTVLGDINQTIAKKADHALYEQIQSILEKKYSTLATMNKSFRCSAEIARFAQRFLAAPIACEYFERHEQEPQIRLYLEEAQGERMLLEDIQACREGGFASMAVLCKSFAQAKELYAHIGQGCQARLVGDQTGQVGLGLSILPIYMAKGLEFDCAFVYGVDARRYHTDDDRQLLYVACTRPLHRLYLYHGEEKSPFL